MKSIFYVLLLGVVSCSKPVLVKNNDLEKENLNGKVKSTYTEEYSVKENNGHFYFQKQIQNKVINFYNAYGLNTYNCNAKQWDKDEFRSDYKFDNQNRIKQQVNVLSDNFYYKMDFYYSKNCTSVLIDANDRFVRKTIDFYNQNRLVRSNQFLQNPKTKKFYLHSYYTYLYNKNKQDSIITYYVYSKKMNTYIVDQEDKYLFDIKTHELQNHSNYQLWYHKNDPANIDFKKRGSSTFRDYRFKYDKHKNWIEKIVEENGVLKGYRRKINYYV